MRIAQVAPLAEAVPPKLYGGTERVVSWLTEELVRMGHDVTLFASGDSHTSAELVPMCKHALRLAGFRDHVPATMVMLAEVRRRAQEFDIIHFHVDVLQHALFSGLENRIITTMHGRLDLRDSMPLYQHFPAMPYVSISANQRKPMPAETHWVATIPHGMPKTLIPFNGRGGAYLAFLGRVCRDKGLDRAIEIAKRARIPLKIAAKIDVADQDYYHSVIAPLLDNELIEFVGEVGDADKPRFLGDAAALLFPIDWPEPFGIVMIEAMAAGTPVIAWSEGSVPEVIDHGRSGFIVNSIEDATAAIPKALALDRGAVRARFEARFTDTLMASRYLDSYRAVISGQKVNGRAKRPDLADPHHAGSLGHEHAGLIRM